MTTPHQLAAATLESVRAARDDAQDLARRLDGIANSLDELTGLLAPPARVPLVTGPPWPKGASFNGAAPTTLDSDPVDPTRPTMLVTLRPRTEGGASSDGHDVHYELPRPLARYAWEVDLRVDAPMLDALTWKFGGMVSFNGDWSKWPAGSTSAAAAGTSNAMERLVGQNTTGDRIKPQWGCYATFPVAVATIPSGKEGVQATVGGVSAWVSNRGHTCHWAIDESPVAGAWAHHRRVVDYRAGGLRHWIDGDLVFELDGLPWPASSPGANQVYVSCMIGGSGPLFLPRTPDRTGRLAYRDYRLHDLGVTA